MSKVSKRDTRQDPAAVVMKHSGPPKAFNQIGVYNFLQEIERIEKTVQNLMEDVLCRSESEHFNLWISDLVQGDSTRAQKINELSLFPTTKSLCYLILFPQKILGMFKLLEQGQQVDETGFIKQGSLRKAKSYQSQHGGTSLSELI